ncbi:MAG: substrate-binding periplasmic protein [Gammaproteobacteria bacterium]
MDPTENLEYLTEDFPPYNFKDQDGKIKGLNVDILIEIFRELGSAKTREDIQIKPWAIAYKEAQDSNKKTVLFSTTKTDVREKLFKWVGPLSYSENAILTLKGNPHGLKIKHEEDIKNFSCGAVLNDLGHSQLKKYGMDDGKIVITLRFDQLLNLLNNKNI